MSTSSHSSTYLPPDRFRGQLARFDRDSFGIVGDGPAMQQVRLQVRRIGPHFRSVLVSGEPGTGKELVARALHGMSEGAAGPFVVCDASTEAARTGKNPAFSNGIAELMDSASGGTLFLDGIGALSLEEQARILLGLRRAWTQDGATGIQRIGIRVIAATHEDLQVLTSAGRLRMELYQKLATIEIRLPPLRERMEDIEGLAIHFLERLAQLHGRSVGGIADDAMEELREHSWPGNVRELESVLQSGVMESEGMVMEKRHLPQLEGAGAREPVIDAGGPARLQDVIERHVLHVLKSCDGNKVRTAELLGISRSTLYRMLDGSSAGGVANGAR